MRIAGPSPDRPAGTGAPPHARCRPDRGTILPGGSVTPGPVGDASASPDPDDRNLVPVLNVGQEVKLRLLVLAWLIASVWFWLWWINPARGEWNAGRVVVTGFLAWAFTMGGYYSFFISRMTRPNPRLPVPALRVAMVVTKAPSEPWDVVRRTLAGMLAQNFPAGYDVWLADEAPTPATRAWCAGHGVRISSRQHVPDYHRAEWPRRDRCKEGNLAYFYDRWAYERYDVVCQLDADHVPSPGYLSAMVGPFRDARVGYVAAPSICDANGQASWTVRGRLYREAAMHGPVQAGCNNGWAPVCIGSHYAVRTAALHHAGGLGPELAEDYSTTLWLASSGWAGVFSIDAEAHGDGPDTFDAMITQERQWAHSLGVIASRWAPSRLGKVPLRARIRLTFALAYYPLQAAVLAAGSTIPSAALLSGSAWGSTTLAGFYAHLWPPALLLTAVTAYLRHCGTLRPATAKLWSLEHTLFQLTRWPWTGWAFLLGMLAGWRHTSETFKVTPKGASRDRLEHRAAPRPAHLIPALILGALPVVSSVSTAHPDRFLGMLAVAILQAAAYLGAVIAVTVPAFLHKPAQTPLLRAWPALLSLALLAGLTAHLVLQTSA